MKPTSHRSTYGACVTSLCPSAPPQQIYTHWVGSRRIGNPSGSLFLVFSDGVSGSTHLCTARSRLVTERESISAYSPCAADIATVHGVHALATGSFWDGPPGLAHDELEVVPCWCCEGSCGAPLRITICAATTPKFLQSPDNPARVPKPTI